MRPPRERPIALRLPPFSASGTAVGFHMSAIHQHLDRRAARGGERLEHPPPDAAAGPAHEPVVQRLARAVGRRCIRPTAARPQHMDDPADHAAVVDAGNAADVSRQQGFKPRPLRIAQPNGSAISRSCLNRNREPHHLTSLQGLMGPDPSGTYAVRVAAFSL